LFLALGTFATEGILIKNNNISFDIVKANRSVLQAYSLQHRPTLYINSLPRRAAMTWRTYCHDISNNQV